jgi:hypothetical protein
MEGFEERNQTEDKLITLTIKDNKMPVTRKIRKTKRTRGSGVTKAPLKLKRMTSIKKARKKRK